MNTYRITVTVLDGPCKFARITVDLEAKNEDSARYRVLQLFSEKTIKDGDGLRIEDIAEVKQCRCFYPVHYRDYANGKYEAWLGEPSVLDEKPIEFLKIGEHVDKGTDWFDSKEAAIQEIKKQCKHIVEHKDFEFYGRNW